jgi:hypothetical protein
MQRKTEQRSLPSRIRSCAIQRILTAVIKPITQNVLQNIVVQRIMVKGDFNIMNKTQKNYKELEKRTRGGFHHWSSQIGDNRFEDNVKPNPKFIKELTESTDLFSVIVFSDYHTTKKAFNNPKFFKKEKEVVASAVSQRVYTNMSKDNYQINERITKNVKDDDSKAIDAEVKKIEKEYRAKAQTELLIEEALYVIEKKDKKLYAKVENEFDDETSNKLALAYLDKHPQVKSKILKNINQENTETRYVRIFNRQLPKALANVLSGFSWQQVFFRKVGKEIFAIKSCSTGSGLRENHGFFGHSFAEVENGGKPVPTYIVKFDKNCKVDVEYSPNLVLYGHELTGNYRIDHDIIKKILKNIKTTFTPNYKKS